MQSVRIRRKKDISSQNVAEDPDRKCNTTPKKAGPRSKAYEIRNAPVKYWLFSHSEQKACTMVAMPPTYPGRGSSPSPSWMAETTLLQVNGFGFLDAPFIVTCATCAYNIIQHAVQIGLYRG